MIYWPMPTAYLHLRTGDKCLGQPFLCGGDGLVDGITDGEI